MQRTEMTYLEFAQARERGLRLAAEALRVNPEKRREMEARKGEAFCRNRWPEAYSKESK